MRNKFTWLLVLMILLVTLLNAQNVGINTTTPQATLDVMGSHRAGGISHYVKNDSTGRIDWYGSNLYVPVTQSLMKHSAAGDGLFYNNTAPVSGQLEYRNASGNPVFYTNFVNGNGYFSGNLGLGTITPQHKLHIYSGASGATSPYGSEMLTLESSGNINMAFLTPDLGETTIWFSKPSQVISDGIFYNNPVARSGFIFRAGNAPRFTIAGNGNIGIGGVNNPLSKLQIYGEETTPDGNAAAVQLTNGAAGSGFNNWFLRTGATGTNTPAGGFSISDNNGYRFVINNSGFVGIGTLSPNAPLTFPPALGKKITLYPGGTGDAGFGVFGNELRINSDHSGADITFGYDNTSSGFQEKMRVKGNGNIGIGNNNPLSKLHVSNGSSGSGSFFSPLAVESNSNTYINILSPNSSESGVLFGKAENAASGGIIYNNMGLGGSPNGFQFRVNGNQTVASINNAGSMGIGMGGISSARLTLAQTPANTDLLLLYLINSFGNGEYHWQMKIGPTPVNHLYFTSNNTDVAYINMTTGAWTTISDRKYKKDIHTLESILPKFMQLNPVSYHMKDDITDETNFGLIAQDLEKVFPDAVKKFDKEGTLGISYTQLIPLAIAAIQEQQRIIEKQQQQIDELKKLVEKLVK